MYDFSGGISDFVVSLVCIAPFAQWRACDRVSFSPHGQLMRVFLASMKFLMQSLSPNSDSVSVKPLRLSGRAASKTACSSSYRKVGVFFRATRAFPITNASSVRLLSDGNTPSGTFPRCRLIQKIDADGN